MVWEHQHCDPSSFATRIQIVVGHCCCYFPLSRRTFVVAQEPFAEEWLLKENAGATDGDHTMVVVPVQSRPHDFLLVLPNGSLAVFHSSVVVVVAEVVVAVLAGPVMVSVDHFLRHGSTDSPRL